MANMEKSILLNDYKEINKISRIDVFLSKKTQKKYACHPDGTFIGMLAADLDKTKPMSVVTVSNEDGETWTFIGNNTREAIDTL